MEKINCAICKDYNFENYLKIPSTVNDINNEYQLVKCKQCSFVYLNPRVEFSKISKYYDDNYLPHKYGNNLYMKIQLIIFKWKRYIIESFANKGKLLDIGSGNNLFIHFMKNYDWIVDSYDEYSNSTIKDLEKCSSNSYDVITLWHSIEHMHNIDDIFLKIKRIIKPNGILLIACPNVESIDSKLLGKQWIAYDVPRHLYHFSYISIQKFLKKNGFIIHTYYRMIQDTFFNIINSKNINIFKKIFYIILSLVSIIFNKRKSSSILYICKLD